MFHMFIFLILMVQFSYEGLSFNLVPNVTYGIAINNHFCLYKHLLLWLFHFLKERI